jgi:hypothetical protein
MNNTVILAMKVGQNIVEYVTGGKNPPDKLTAREVRNVDPYPYPTRRSQRNERGKPKQRVAK